MTGPDAEKQAVTPTSPNKANRPVRKRTGSKAGDVLSVEMKEMKNENGSNGR